MRDLHEKILNSVLVGDTEDKEILQAQHPSTALLLPFSISSLPPQVSEMTVLHELSWKGLSDKPFLCPTLTTFLGKFCWFWPLPPLHFTREIRDGENFFKACQSKQRICFVCQLRKSNIHVIRAAKLLGRKGLSAEFPAPQTLQQRC